MKRYFFPGFLVFLFPVILVAAEVKEYAFTDFLRLTKSEDGRQLISYDTAIAKFFDERNNAEVHLVGVIHVGDKEYYEELNKLFKKYDAVLYELVAEQGVRPDRNRSHTSADGGILSAIQTGMGAALGLEHQLDHIDYHAANMIHADLTPAEFARRMADRGDLVQMFYRAMALSTQRSGTDAQRDESRTIGRFLASFFAPDPTLSRRRLLAEEMMNQLDDSGWIIGGEESAIITDRNEAALQVLRQELRNGKKKIAIFYGAAHLPEFARSLERDFQMKKTGTAWLIAWDLTRDRSARK